ncbi:PREDICTED: RNA-binding protein 4B-like isoform X2 [Calidris pugnax]|uniref:RNA-binding protein 4B-like isoform X2 n=1 Tax=Calidris pugnax TaxID=198806 RepID=UPI00071D6CD5|nr:PREDICTED: RNA-binding protein 4B-like isoform X2 [Calidris pugnax]
MGSTSSWGGSSADSPPAESPLRFLRRSPEGPWRSGLVSSGPFWGGRCGYGFYLFLGGVPQLIPTPPTPRLGEMVKLFIGNLPREATEQEIRSLFEQYGKVLECDIIKNYGFVHIEDKTAAEDAIRNLHHHKLHGVCINVEASKNKSKASTKLHVGNISPACTNLELRAKFEEYGPVIECDIVKDYAFVHMERAEDAVEAIRGLDNTEFQAGGSRR